jgi:hypothetical protein
MIRAMRTANRHGMLLVHDMVLRYTIRAPAYGGLLGYLSLGIAGAYIYYYFLLLLAIRKEES